MMILQGLFDACSSAHQAQAEHSSAEAMQNAQLADVQQQQAAMNLTYPGGFDEHGVWRPVFGCAIRWRGETYEVGDCKLPDEAKIKAIWMAEKQGWTNPRWYEFWRIWRGDTWFDPAGIARLKAKYEGDNQLSEEVS